MAAPVSVVIPCWRCRDTITRAVESVAMQTWLPQEVILVDDASGDGTADILHALAGRFLPGWIKVIELQVNSGASVARNEGWGVATSPYVAFLDADDAWHPKKLEIQLAWMEAHVEAAFSGTLTTVITQLQDRPLVSDRYHVQEVTFRRMLFRNLLPTRSVVVRTTVPHRFLPGKRYCQDYELWLAAIADGHQAFLIELPLSYSFKHDFGSSGLSADLWAFHRDIIDTYKRLYRAGHITGLTYAIISLWEFVKLLRRVTFCAMPLRKL